MCDSLIDWLSFSGLGDDVVRCKKAAIVAIFILYIVYETCIGVSILTKIDCSSFKKKND